ncbi:MAG: L-erythro-3,5-diaminohexanoate dehydrogenase [Deltaproteobacteria bacterium]|nr:L-erythro-3,5-diaminohexanoate dehydrogenase [Deltaproteobacteria bacterium]
MRGPGDHYGCHRSLIPAGGFPQAAEKLDSSLPIYQNEILISVERLNIDAASFHQIRTAAHDSEDKIRRQILEIVQKRGKMHNPVTNSGGMLLGTVKEIGPKVSHKGFSVGDRIATLVSLTLTPLALEEIQEIDLEGDQIAVKGDAILFESGIAHKIPPDLPEKIALAVFDVCGAPALTMHLTHVGETVVIFGTGKAGLLAAAAVRKKIGHAGQIFLFDRSPEAVEAAKGLSFINDAIVVDATDPKSVREVVSERTGSRMADLVINCANVRGTEVSSILSAKRSGTVLFFNMATNFQAAVLGAEGIGHETRLIMGNGYYPGHADLALNLVREIPELKVWFERRFGNP